MAEDRNDMDDAALDWVIRLREPGFDGWDAFQAWLAADPAHATIYHRLAITEAKLDDLFKAPLVIARSDIAPIRRPATRRAWLGGAIAASIAGIVGLGMIERQPALYQIETAPGARRTIALEDGSRITLNGGTRLTLDRKNARYAMVERGEAMFNVVHDENAPFRVSVGDATLVDAGTAFNVLRERGAIEVEVAEGAVVYNPDGEAVRLGPGRTLRTIDGEPHLVLGMVNPSSVAGWREGRLIYDGQTIAEVADDLARWSGEAVRADPAVADKRFRGVLSLSDGEDIVRLAPLLDVDVRRSGSEWVLSQRSQ